MLNGNTAPAFSNYIKIYAYNDNHYKFVSKLELKLELKSKSGAKDWFCSRVGPGENTGRWLHNGNVIVVALEDRQDAGMKLSMLPGR